MGNTRSEVFEPVGVDLWWNDNRRENTTKETKNKEILEFRTRRIQIVGEKKREMDELRRENGELKKLLMESRGNTDASQQTEDFEVPGEELERVRSQLLSFEDERNEYKTHVVALKDIIAVSKELLLMREGQIKELGAKFEEIQATLAQHQLESFSNELRLEYDRQLKNMKQLRVLYEERQKSDKVEKDKLKNELEEVKSNLSLYENKNCELQARVDELEKDTSDKYDVIVDLDSQLGLTKAECAEVRSQMSAINQLFSQILVGFNNGREVDLDKLTERLEENHDILIDIVVNQESAQSSALPKVLLDLVTQVNEKNPPEASTPIAEESEPPSSSQQNSLSPASEIVQNLPKVWKVLTELLSHQTAPISVLNNDEQADKNPCYKSVQTPTGPALVLSVSKTYIRLKNLIVEKKSLEKETMRLKQLNTHLETRLQDQEKRLEMVSSELSKTWNVVGKMQKQHQQLHTQEKILRYELAQKRKLLNELKEELEYCREKWLQARAKNSITEEQWKQLRNEFAARKTVIGEDSHNSVESGYSDDRESSGSDEEAVPDDGKQTILNVIKDEIAKIESLQEGALIIPEPPRTSVEDAIETPKTDLAQKDRRQDINDTYKKLEEDILETIKKTQNGGEEFPSTSRSRTIDETLAAKEDRLKLLEEQSSRLTSPVTNGGSDETSSILHQEYEEQPGTSSSNGRSSEDALARREERLRSMEEQAQQLVKQVRQHSARNSQFCRKLNNLHDRYGESSECSSEEAECEDCSSSHAREEEEREGQN